MFDKFSFLFKSFDHAVARSVPVSTPMLDRLVDEAAGPLIGLKLLLALRLGGANPARD